MMSLLWSEHAQSDEDTGQSVASIPGGGRGGEEGGEGRQRRKEGGEEIERYMWHKFKKT